MILLASDCLLFQMPNGETIPFSATAISVELIGGKDGVYDIEFVRQVAGAVFHYFKNDLGRFMVTPAEFSDALEQALRNFGWHIESATTLPGAEANPESDLRLLAAEAGRTELLFFPRLRDELRSQLRQSPRVLRFRGLRGCVKQLAGARRWSPRCRHLHDRILDYLDSCLSAEGQKNQCLLLVK